MSRCVCTELQPLHGNRALEIEQPVEETTASTAAAPAPGIPEPPREPVSAEAEASPEDRVGVALDLDERLARARSHLSMQALDDSVDDYEQLLREPGLAPALIEELETAVETHATHAALQRVLGDAYVRAGQLQKALQAYRQALAKL